MTKIYKNINGRIMEEGGFVNGCWVHLCEPDREEINAVCDRFSVPESFVRAALDEEERSRIDEEDSIMLIVVDTPTAEKDSNDFYYSTIPFGIIITDDAVITVCAKETALTRQITDGTVKDVSTKKTRRFTLQLLFQNATLFLYYLRRTDKDVIRAEKELRRTMQNKELIRLLSLEKSLVYFSTGLKGDEAVLEKLARMKFISAYPEDAELLEDVIVENRQAIEMCNIYRDILSGTMDAYSSVISNNLNSVMKLLASLTIVLTIPQLIFSLWGINTPVPFENVQFGFYIVLALAGVATLVSIGFAIYKKWLK